MQTWGIATLVGTGGKTKRDKNVEYLSDSET